MIATEFGLSDVLSVVLALVIEKIVLGNTVCYRKIPLHFTLYYRDRYYCAKKRKQNLLEKENIYIASLLDFPCKMNRIQQKDGILFLRLDYNMPVASKVEHLTLNSNLKNIINLFC
ncbi:hypothetical protein CEXT_383081 [Caerostris extrusa]|uniref:Uncharacterized protein n=1 Tax=Caerostris extrusa TaxID=172846 RepID=A0AAV4XUT4_CAEEX|nr:hypothetical protein CEXT_383081 [Caerostris extrusa]